MEVIGIPDCLIETGWARKLLPAWATEHSVFYLYGVDWDHLYRPPNIWWRFYYGQRN